MRLVSAVPPAVSGGRQKAQFCLLFLPVGCAGLPTDATFRPRLCIDATTPGGSEGHVHNPNFGSEEGIVRT